MPLDPGSPRQVRLFAAMSHDPAIAKAHGMSMGKAREMLMATPAKKRSSAMRGMFRRRKRKSMQREAR